MTINNQVISLDARQILLKRGNLATSSTYVGPLGELTVDTTLKTLRIHDGVTPGGAPIPTDGVVDMQANSYSEFYSNLYVQQGLVVILANLANTLGRVEEVNSNLVATIGAVYPIELSTLEGIATSINNDPDFYGFVANSVSSLQSNIGAETVRAYAAEAALQTAINNEANIRLANDNLINSNISATANAVVAEANVRLAEDTAIRVVAAQNAANLSAEISARITGDVNLQANIAAETAARTANASALAASLQAANVSMTANLAAESAARIANVIVEANRAISAEGNLQLDINTERAQRIVEDNNIKSNLTIETSRAISEEGNLRANITAESVARVANTSALAASLIAANISHTANLAAESSARVANVIVERTRAVAAETLLQNNLDSANVARISNISSVITLVNSTFTQANLDRTTNISAVITSVNNTFNQANIDRVSNISAVITSMNNTFTAANIDRISNISAVITNMNNTFAAANTARESNVSAVITSLQNNINTTNTAWQANSATTLQALTAANIARAAGDTALQASLDAANIARIANVSVLTAALDNEIVQRVANVTNLQTQINNVLVNVDATALNSLVEVVAAFQASDNTLQGAITALSTQLNTDINLERSRAQAAESAIQANLNTETATRISNTSVLAGSLNAANIALTAAINAEAAARAAADVNLQSNITAEVTRATTVETGLQTQVTNTNTALTNNVAAIFANIALEITNRVNDVNTEESARILADTTITNNLNTESANRIANASALAASVTAETARATAAESAIRANVTVLQGTEHQLLAGGYSANLNAVGGTFEVPGHILPKNHLTQDLGSASQAFRSLFISSSTVYFGTASLTVDPVNGLRAETSGGTPIAVKGNVTFPDSTVQTTAFLPSFITTETANRTANAAALAQSVITETTRATAAETALQAQITSLGSGTTSAITANINAEAATRLAADIALQANIDAANVARIADVSSLQSAINSESAARVANASAIVTSILANESTRLSNAAALATSIAAETARAISEEGNLRSNINSVISQLGNNTENNLVNGSFYANLTATGNLTLPGNVTPLSTDQFDLGSESLRWSDIYIANTGLHMGNATVRVGDYGNVDIVTRELADQIGAEAIEWTTSSTVIFYAYENTELYNLLVTFSGGEVIEVLTPFVNSLVIRSQGSIGSLTQVAGSSPAVFYRPITFAVDQAMPGPLVNVPGTVFTYQYLYTYKLRFKAQSIVSKLTNTLLSMDLERTGNVNVPGNVIPKTTAAHDLGSSVAAFRTAYVGNTINMGNTVVSSDFGNGLQVTTSAGANLPYVGNVKFLDGRVQTTAFWPEFITQLQANIDAANVARTSNISAVITSVNATFTAANTAWQANTANLQTQIDSILNNVDATALNSLAEIIANYQSVDTIINAAVSTETVRATAAEGNIAANVIAANVAWTANAAAQATEITNLWANAAAQTTSLATLTANSESQQTTIDSLSANAASQQSAIVTLQSQVYANANVADYLLTNTGNVAAGNISFSGNINGSGAGLTGFADVARTGAYADLTGTPTIPVYTDVPNYLDGNIAANLIPSSNVTYDLGSDTRRWRDLYLSGSTINFGNALIKTDADTGLIAFVPPPAPSRPNPQAIVFTPEGQMVPVDTVAGNVNFATANVKVQNNPGINRPAVFTITANGSSAYVFAADGRFFATATNNPTLNLRRGETYRFINNSGGGHPFQIVEETGSEDGPTLTAYNVGVTNNGAASGEIIFTVPMNAPARLRYRCTVHAVMSGAINVDGNERVQPPANNLEQKFEIRAANFAVIPNRRYGINTNNGSITATLPVPPAVAPGDAVFFADAGGAYTANSFVILAGGGTTITNTSNSSSGTLVINTNGDSIGLFWTGTTWRMYE